MNIAILIISILILLGSIFSFLMFTVLYYDLYKRTQDITKQLQIIFKQNGNMFKKVEYIEDQLIQKEAERLSVDKNDPINEFARKYGPLIDNEYVGGLIYGAQYDKKDFSSCGSFTVNDPGSDRVGLVARRSYLVDIRVDRDSSNTNAACYKADP